MKKLEEKEEKVWRICDTKIHGEESLIKTSKVDVLKRQGKRRLSSLYFSFKYFALIYLM